jgi:hypothetical protein
VATISSRHTARLEPRGEWTLSPMGTKSDRAISPHSPSRTAPNVNGLRKFDVRSVTPGAFSMIGGVVDQAALRG